MNSIDKYYYHPKYKYHYMVHALGRDYEVDYERWKKLRLLYQDYIYKLNINGPNFKEIYIRTEDLDPLPRISKIHDAYRIKFPYYDTSNPPCGLYDNCHEGKGRMGFVCPKLIGFDCGDTFFVICRHDFERKPIQLTLNFID